MENAEEYQANLLEQFMSLSREMPDELKQKVNSLLSSTKTFGQLQGVKPKTLDTMYAAAYILYQSGQYEKALKMFQSLTLLDHFEFKYFFGLASCYQQLKNYKDAVTIYGVAYMLEPHDPAVPFHSAYCHMQLEDYEAAQSGYYAASVWAGERPEYSELKEQALVMEKLMKEKSDKKKKAK